MQENETKEMIKYLVNTFNHYTNRIDLFYRYLALLIPKLLQIANKNNKKRLMQDLINKLSDKVSKSSDVTLSYNNDEYKSELKEPDLGYASKLLLLSLYI